MKSLLTIALILFALPAAARAERQAVNGGEHVVHTRRAPVVLHRAVPPFKGVHVYQGRR